MRMLGSITLALPALLLVGLAAGTTPASAADLVVWQGTATILTANRACESDVGERRTIGVGTVLRTLYRPKSLGANGDDSRLSFNHDGQANFLILLPGGGLPSGVYSAFGVKYNGVLAANETGDYRRFDQTPNNPKASTTFITYTGVIENFMFVPGCTVSFRAVYAPRP